MRVNFRRRSNHTEKASLLIELGHDTSKRTAKVVVQLDKALEESKFLKEKATIAKEQFQDGICTPSKHR